VKVGSGRAAFASEAIEINPSYLPAGTSQVEPPACETTETECRKLVLVVALTEEADLNVVAAKQYGS